MTSKIAPVSGFQFMGNVFPTLPEAEKAERLYVAENDLREATEWLGDEMLSHYERNEFHSDRRDGFRSAAADLFPIYGDDKGRSEGFFEALSLAQDAHKRVKKERGQGLPTPTPEPKS